MMMSSQSAGNSIDTTLSLDQLGILEGTDKSSLNHDYLRHYERLFSYLRFAQINVIELGVQGGQSLRMWSRFFPNSVVVGLDMNPQCKRHEQARISVYTGSQDDVELLANICSVYPPTIIIDDASHLGGQTLASLENMFNSLLPGGFYVVEDLFLHLGPDAPQWLSYAKEPVPNYFHGLMDRLMGTRRLTTPAWANETGLRKYLFDQTDWICVANSALMIRKKEKRPTIEEWSRKAQALLRDSHSGRAWEILCESLMRQHGPSEDAETAIRKAIEITPLLDRLHRRPSIVLEQQGRLEEALTAATMALHLQKGAENEQRIQRLATRMAVRRQ